MKQNFDLQVVMLMSLSNHVSLCLYISLSVYLFVRIFLCPSFHGQLAVHVGRFFNETRKRDRLHLPPDLLAKSIDPKRQGQGSTIFLLPFDMTCVVSLESPRK